jgi:hypothetical protein
MYFNFIKGTIFAKKMQEYSIILALYNGEAYFIIQEEEVDMKKYKIGILALAAFSLGSTAASATTIGLYEYAFNFDGNIAPAGVSLAGFNASTGLGTISFSTSADGAHSFLAFFDHEIDEAANTFFNEYGDTNGSAASGQSWEIDEPGWDLNNPGDIYTNFSSSDNISGSLLDKYNAVPSGSENDVSMAMGWDFFLAADETAIITMTLSTTQPTGGFYLAQFDPDSSVGALPAGIYFSSNLNIQGGGIVPEPGTMLLMATGLTGLLGTCMRRKMKK